MKEKLMEELTPLLSEVGVKIYDISFEKEDGVDTLFIKIDSDKEVDTELSDFCFANLCSLSEWYYMWCEPNEEIPMNFRRKVKRSNSGRGSNKRGKNN